MFPNPDRASFIDRPFACPPDIEIDLPPPISVNKLRKKDPASAPLVRRWVNQADALMFAAKCRTQNPLRGRKMDAQFEVQLILNECLTGIDLDNSCKGILDYLKRVELIVDDGPKYMRRVVIEWGIAPHGCRLILKPWVVA